MTRITGKPPRDSGWLDYHAGMTGKHAYFVRGCGFEPFYTNESFASLKEFASSYDYAHVINCDWKPDLWQSQPYMYVITAEGCYEKFATRSTEAPNHASFDISGVRKDGKWLEKRFYDVIDGKNGPSVTSFNWHHSGHCLVIHNASSFTRSESGIWSITYGGSSVNLSGIPADQLITQARRMQAGKWNGFYDDLVVFLINDGLDSRFL